MTISISLIHKQLMLTIAQQQLTVSPETSVMAAIAIMGEMGASCVIISGSEGRELMGLFTERDLIRICVKSVPLAQLTMQSVMSHPVITIQETGLNNINDVMTLFQTHQIRHLPVLNGDRIIGVLTKDVLTEILAQTALNFDLNSSDREQAEIALQKSEQRYRTLMDGASDAILLADTKGNLIEINKKGEELLGYSRDELKHLHISQIHPPEVLEAARNHFQSIMQQDLEVRLETLVLSKNGRQTPVEIIGNLINLEGEQIIQGIFRDISDRKQAEAQLQTVNEQLRQSNDQLAQSVLTLERNNALSTVMQEASFDGILVIDEQRRVLTYNQKFVRQWHIPQEIVTEGNDRQLLATALSQLTNPNEFLELVEHLYENPKKISRDEISFIDGRTFDRCSAPIYWDSKYYGRIWFYRDISDRKKYEQQLEQTNAELLRATRLKDEFLAAMSHELRTPLNVILGMSEALQEEVFGILTERQITALQTVESSGYHLLELINDILDMAKIEAGQVELSYEATAIAQLAQSSITFINQQALKKQIQLEMQIAPNLPDISIDERRIRQVLINLLNNAVKFTPEGGQIKLEVDRQQDQSSPNRSAWLRFSISDTGIGIAPENIPKLFQPFIQIDSALNRKYEGTGLGLALVKQIVDLHGGKVSLTSELGVGSCFVVDIPYKNIVLTPSDSQTPINLNLETDKPEQTTSPLILIAEDNETLKPKKM